MKQLIIEDVPDDEVVKIEIICNAESTIRNYWDRVIRAEHTEIEAEITAKVEEFKTANKMGVEKMPVEEPLE